MPYEEQVNRGNIWTNRQKRKENHPDYRGEIEIDLLTLKELVDKAKAGQPAKIEIALWTRSSEKAGTYHRASIGVAREREEREESPPFTSDLSGTQAKMPWED